MLSLPAKGSVLAFGMLAGWEGGIRHSPLAMLASLGLTLGVYLAIDPVIRLITFLYRRVRR